MLYLSDSHEDISLSINHCCSPIESTVIPMLENLQQKIDLPCGLIGRLADKIFYVLNISVEGFPRIQCILLENTQDPQSKTYRVEKVERQKKRRYCSFSCFLCISHLMQSMHYIAIFIFTTDTSSFLL